MCLAKPARIESIDNGTAFCDLSGIKKKVSLDLLSGIVVGDFVLIHAGFAISKIDKAQAEETVEALRELGEAIRD